GPFYPNDTLFVSLFNGTETVDIAKFYKDNTDMSLWYPYSIPVGGLITLTNTMQLIVTISDYTATVNICEAAFDHFSVTDFSMSQITNETIAEILVYPNPASAEVFIKGIEQGEFEFYDLTGRLIQKNRLTDRLDVSVLENGVYVLVLK